MEYFVHSDPRNECCLPGPIMAIQFPPLRPSLPFSGFAKDDCAVFRHLEALGASVWNPAYVR